MPGGRPSDIDAVFDQVIEDIRIGCYTEDAAAHAGINKASLYDWQKLGAQAERLRAKNPDVELTPHQLRCIEFTNAVTAARAEWVVHANALLERLARGGIITESITERTNAKGELVERTVKRDASLPDKAVLFWRLERTMPQSYGRRVAIEVEPATTDERVGKVAELFEAYLAGRDDAVTPAKNGNGKTAEV